jgi:hypothetical protein
VLLLSVWWLGALRLVASTEVVDGETATS